MSTQDLLFITGNQHKADYLAKWLGIPLKHHKFDLEELQSLDLRQVVEHKVRQAYALAGQPVLVEDVALTFTAMGRLPGTFIKWFLEEIGPEGLAKLADGLPHRQAVASIIYAYYDGTETHFFEGQTAGTVAPSPRGESTFGKNSWNGIFIPQGSDKTYAEMTDDELRPFSHRFQAIAKLEAFLKQQ
jgi:inosine triphosphate pyrophosphatase